MKRRRAARGSGGQSGAEGESGDSGAPANGEGGGRSGGDAAITWSAYKSMALDATPPPAPTAKPAE